MYSQHSFPVTEISNSRRISMEERNLIYKVNYDFKGDLVATVSAKFAKGNQIKTNVTSDRIIECTTKVPASNWDMLKHVLVSWIPSLNFGWLVPKYKYINTLVTVNKTATYLNVYPIEAENQKSYVDMIQISPVEWLYAEPMTKAEYQEEEVKVKQFSGRDCAEFMSSYRIKNDIRCGEPVGEEFW